MPAIVTAMSSPPAASTATGSNPSLIATTVCDGPFRVTLRTVTCCAPGKLPDAADRKAVDAVAGAAARDAAGGELNSVSRALETTTLDVTGVTAGAPPGSV